ncbi:hypothetical protein HHK36_009862 [Tetracentron sinense]|uniref:Uncharacterized protein n=1 Tax=Tetracentron sinense TaxID=13715 RepID=A0A834ZDG6_TETSI|nr:hypothetical protein HHK36_013536 [Tetracentron sinense]KAF8404967.1 hypothetical protein HHK36_009862 [Tetracentron sinense]
MDLVLQCKSLKFPRLEDYIMNEKLKEYVSDLETAFLPEGTRFIQEQFPNQVKKRNSEESSTQWTTGIAEVQLPIEYKLRNIEETEAAKKLLQDKRLVGRSKAELSIPSSYSADYFQRGRDYAEKLRREHPELYKDRAVQENGAGPRQADTANTKAAGRRQAATDEFMLERFRKRERHRGMRR